MSGVVLAPETTTDVVSPQCANPKRIDDASTLAKGLLGVSLVPEITVQSVPDATSSPSIDQEVPSVFHPVPFRFSFDPLSDPSSVCAFVKAYPNLPGYHMWSSWDRLTVVSTYGPPGSEEEDELDSGWDFSGLRAPSAMRDFMTACDYCLSDCSDDGHNLDDEGCGPSRECFHVDLGGHDEGNHLGMPEDDDPPGPAPHVDILQELVVVPVPAGGQDTQLEQIHEMQAKLDEGAGQLVQLRQNIKQEWAGRVKQPLHRFDEEKRRAIGEEIHKLMAAGFIKKVFHPEWLANLVLVKKKGGKWRMCVDYTGLNKACPKVPYPLPRIDQIVDSTTGCKTLSFLDAYSGYHQIKMKESDQLATSFITPFGMYCYTTMPFGLRNVGATYQRCMNHVFGEHIGQTVEAYVEDIIVKTRKASDLLSDLETTFKCLRAKGVKLNPEKCVFGVPRGMLLGFIISERGIEANPEKIAAITNMGPIKDLKGVQRVMGCLAALSRFISRLVEKGLTMYCLLRKAERFTWTPEAEEALGNLKALLTNVPIFVPPAAGEALLIYVAATTQVVSDAIVVERREEGHTLLVQRPVYFISEVLSETKIRYPQIQKLLYAVILTRRKLRHYFESHPVTVVSSFPLGEIIQCREASGRIAKWAVELVGKTISFAPRKAIKSQVLADFGAEWVDTQLPIAPIQPELWTMYFDGR
jgi:hypothetical protein